MPRPGSTDELNFQAVIAAAEAMKIPHEVIVVPNIKHLDFHTQQDTYAPIVGASVGKFIWEKVLGAPK